MEELDELLNQLEAAGRDVGIYRNYHPKLRDVVFGLEAGGSKGNESGRIDDRLLEPLQLLANLGR